MHNTFAAHARQQTMTRTHVPASSAFDPRGNDPRRLAWSVLSVLWQRETYFALVYHLVSLPLGVAYFVYLVTGIVTAAALAILSVGIFLPVAVMAGWVYLAECDRAMSNVLLGTHVPPLRRAYSNSVPVRPSSVMAWLRTEMTWRSLVYLAARFVQGIFTFTVATFVIGVALAWMLAPAFLWLLNSVDASEASIDLFSWQIDTYGEAWLAAPLGFVALVAGLHVSNGVAWLSARMTEQLLTMRAPAAPGPLLVEPAGPVLPATDEVAGVKATLRGSVADEASAAPSPIEVDADAREARVDGATIALTPKEFDLLALLVCNAGRAFSRADLLDRVWTDNLDVTDRTIDTHVQRLRRKLGDQAAVIETVRGIGYRYRQPQ